MKKGLLTVLLASLVLVGCQNYDDQFDDLNAQISALKSQVDGLSALSGQVSSLSGTISGLQSGISAAQASADSAALAASAIDLSGLSASLTALQAEVDAIEDAIALAATATEVAALQASLTGVEADLADLLVSNNVYSTTIAITDAASMAAALALGNKVALMNATVTITDASTVADADIQTFVNRIKTMNNTFTYDSGSATGFVPTFDEMISAKAITLTPAGDISFKKLTAATTIRINDDYETKITSVDFGALTSVTDFTDDATVKQIDLTAATNIDLGSLSRLTTTSADPFVLKMKKGATLDIASLDDVSTTGIQEDIYLNIDGAASVTLTAMADGDIGLTNVATASVSNFFGTLDVDSGVETLTVVDGVNLDLAGSSDLVTATLDFAYDYDPALSTATAAIAAAGYSSTYTQDLDDASIDFSDLESLTVTGKLMDLYVDGTELETLSIDATMHDLTISGATDLTTLTVASGSSIGNINLTGTTNLAVADFNHTSNLTDTDATAQKSVTLSATNNTGLTKLHSTGDDVDTLTITGNAALAELDFTGLADDGAETTPTPGVTIWGNALVATEANNTVDADTATSTTGAAGGSADAGNFNDGTSGMDTLKTYLTHIAATSGSTAFVTFDTVQTETDTETTTTSTELNVTDAGDGITTNKATVLKMTPAVANTAAAAKDAIAVKKGFVVTPTTTIVLFNVGSETVTIPAGTGDGPSANRGYTLLGNNAVDAANIASTANKDLASTLGMTLNAYNKGNSYTTVSLIYHNPVRADRSTADLGERYTATEVAAATTTDTRGASGDQLWSTSVKDLVTFTVGTNSVTTSIAATWGAAGGVAYTNTATTLAAIEQAISAAWGAKYGTTGTASAAAIATLVRSAVVGDGTIHVEALQTDSGGHDLDVSISIANSGAATNSSTGANLDWVIGGTNTSGDNSTIATTTAAGIIITLESNSSAVDATSGVVDSSAGNSMTALSTNYTTNTTWAPGTLQTGTTVERTDVRNAEALVDAAASNASAAVLFNRVTWLG
jgi:hypothetical protein